MGLLLCINCFFIETGQTTLVTTEDASSKETTTTTTRARTKTATTTTITTTTTNNNETSIDCIERDTPFRIAQRGEKYWVLNNYIQSDIRHKCRLRKKC